MRKCAREDFSWTKLNGRAHKRQRNYGGSDKRKVENHRRICKYIEVCIIIIEEAKH